MNKDENNNEKINEYELALLIKDEKDLDGIYKILSSLGISVKDKSDFNSIKLAYKINNENYALFGSLYFDSNSNKIKDITKELNLLNTALRFIIIKNPVFGKFSGKTSFKSKKYEKGNMHTSLSKSESVSDNKNIHRKEQVTTEELEKKLEEILQ